VYEAMDATGIHAGYYTLISKLRSEL